MKKISLISNTSIQYYKFETTIDLESYKTNKIYYNEPFDNKLQCFIYDPLCKVMIDGEEFFYRKQELIEKELIIDNKIIEDSDFSTLKNILDPFVNSNLKKALKTLSV
jgi:hypothetical protein